MSVENIKQFIKNELTGWQRWEIVWLSISVSVIIGLSIYWGDNLRGIIAAVTGVLYVLITGKGKLSGYLFGLVNALLYGIIALEAKYYGEVMLNLLYYVPMQIVGWFAWKKNMNSETNEVNKKKLSVKAELVLFAGSVVAIYIYSLVLKYLGGNLPLIDSISTCLSVTAMILSVGRFLEQWILWFIVDVVTVYMWYVDYVNGGSDIATLIMWIIYVISAVLMFVKWFRDVSVKNCVDS